MLNYNIPQKKEGVFIIFYEICKMNPLKSIGCCGKFKNKQSSLNFRM